MKIQKTNVARILDARNIEYTFHTYEHKDKDPVDGVHVANMLGLPVEQVFKTLVTIANTKEYLVFMLPVDKELSLKKAAVAAGVKSLEMIHVKDINKVTGYIRGGCSPIGMKKEFRTFIDETCILQETIYFSAGKIGTQIEMNPEVFMEAFHVTPYDLTK
ncbi:MAG: Cys-tRNA(Pro) deacylase [Faecalicoccus sp.]|nr:Cys-tRNA(Pro) deacylase [Faecalicoccus sp.]